MKLTSAIDKMGFRLIDINESDLEDYIYLRRTVYKKYIDENNDYFGEWDDKFSSDEFYYKIKLTFFKKLLLNDEIVGFMNYDHKKDKINDVTIYLTDKAQGKGIGTIFISNLIKLSKYRRRFLMRYNLTIAVTKSENWYVAKCIENSVASQGKSMDEALSNLKEALELYYEDNDDIPIVQPTFITTMEIAV